MTVFDLIVVAVFALSIGFAVIRGALREIGTLLALGVAALGAIWLARPLQGAAGASESFLATIAIGAAILFVLFCVFYFGLHVVLSRIKLTGRAARIDRISGGVFGFARGLVLVGLGFLAYGYYLDDERRPAAVNQALTLPIAKGMAAFFERLAPASTKLDAEPAATTVDEQANAVIEGYDRGERAALSEIVATATTSDDAADRATKRPVEESETKSEDDPIADLLKEGDPE